MPLPPPPNPEQRVKILLCGYGHLGYALLQGLLTCQDRCEIVGVFRWSSRPASQHFWEPVEDQFKKQVEDAQLLDISCPGVNSYEFSALLESLKPHVLLIGSWGEIIKPHLINRPDLLLINCHPSKLPAHRGANPYSSVIRTEERETGVTFHRIVEAIDAGAILLQTTVPLTTHEHGLSVRDKCAEAAQQMVPHLLEQLAVHLQTGEPLQESPQDENQQSTYPQLKREDGLINWQHSIHEIGRQFRALYPWIISYSYLDGKHQVLFYNPQFIENTLDVPPTSYTPGEILHYQQNTLYIATQDPQCLLVVSLFQLIDPPFGLPPWIFQIAYPWYFRKGKCFRNPIAP